ncbi:unnamed protein product [Fraxinus pennsylvanica]|uniref:CCHC-type domain-containing protein n=1 Tax=Fraxinus pennsylvanica TaxID=56036 RepID=A0AAD2DQQ0_9LAMI|nr:unnamed protein product [Fraxinus pennsylvanica]
MVFTWILNTITPPLANSLDYHDDLESRFCHGNNACFFHLKSEISNLHQNHSSIPDYYNHIKQLWDELGIIQTPADATTLEKRAEDERVFQFLLGLNDSFTALRSQILATDPLPSLNKVFSILFQEEQQRLLHVSRTPSKNVALAGRSSHPDRPPLKCTECGKDGHLRNRCWLIIGYPLDANPVTTGSHHCSENLLPQPFSSPKLPPVQCQGSR